MFALDIDLNVLLGVCVALGVLCLILLFVSARRKRDSLELQQDLNKNIEDFNRLLEKFDAVTARKNQLEQEVVKAQATADGLQIRLNERDEKVQYLQTELNEEQARHSSIAEQITTLKERFGVASAKPSADCPQRRIAGKFNGKTHRTFAGIGGIENHVNGKRKAFCRAATTC